MNLTAFCCFIISSHNYVTWWVSRYHVIVIKGLMYIAQALKCSSGDPTCVLSSLFHCKGWVFQRIANKPCMLSKQQAANDSRHLWTIHGKRTTPKRFSIIVWSSGTSLGAGLCQDWDSDSRSQMIFTHVEMQGILCYLSRLGRGRTQQCYLYRMTAVAKEWNMKWIQYHDIDDITIFQII